MFLFFEDVIAENVTPSLRQTKTIWCGAALTRIIMIALTKIIIIALTRLNKIDNISHEGNCRMKEYEKYHHNTQI